MDKALLGAIIGAGITIIYTLYVFGEDLKVANRQSDLIIACEKDLPRSSTCEIYAKEKINEPRRN